jgi:FdhE protein
MNDGSKETTDGAADRDAGFGTASLGDAPLEVAECLMRLDQLERLRPELADLTRLHRSLIPALFRSGESPPAFAAASSDLAQVVSTGIPLFRRQMPQLDDWRLAASWRLICDLLARHRDPEQPLKLADAVRAKRFSPAGALHTLFAAGPTELRGELARLPADVRLVMSVFRLAALPSLALITARLAIGWRRLGWSRGYCPACGSWPLVAELRGLEQFRRLRCGLCGSDWQVDRLFCPFCETRDHRHLEDLFVEGEDQKSRVSVCDACRSFVRAVSTLTALSAPGLLIADLETLHLALLAAERGYVEATD